MRSSGAHWPVSLSASQPVSDATYQSQYPLCGHLCTYLCSWLRSSGAHRPVAHLTSDFEVVSGPSEREDALVRLCDEREGRTLVFANSAARANDALKHLAASGISASGLRLDVPCDTSLS